MSSSSDPFSGIIQYMNEYRRDSLLLYAWSLMGHKNTVSATMTELTLSSFTLKLNKKSPFGQNKEIECTYNFETKLLAPSEAKERLIQLHQRSSMVCWPAGAAPWITLLIWGSLILSVANDSDISSLKFLLPIRDMSLKLYRTPDIAAYILFGMIALHTLEAMYVMYLLKKINLSGGAINTWASLTLFLGFPVTSMASTLNSVGTSSKKVH